LERKSVHRAEASEPRLMGQDRPTDMIEDKVYKDCGERQHGETSGYQSRVLRCPQCLGSK
jgi:hypothetical protein